MAVTAAEESAQPRLLLAQRRTPERNRAVIRAFLRVLGVVYTDAEVVAPVEAPIDVRFREAQFHLRELRDHPRERDWQEQHTRVDQGRACADGGDLHSLTEGVRRAPPARDRRAGCACRVVWRKVYWAGCPSSCR